MTDFGWVLLIALLFFLVGMVCGGKLIGESVYRDIERTGHWSFGDRGVVTGRVDRTEVGK